MKPALRCTFITVAALVSAILPTVAQNDPGRRAFEAAPLRRMPDYGLTADAAAVTDHLRGLRVKAMHRVAADFPDSPWAAHARAELARLKPALREQALQEARRLMGQAPPEADWLEAIYQLADIGLPRSPIDVAAVDEVLDYFQMVAQTQQNQAPALAAQARFHMVMFLKGHPLPVQPKPGVIMPRPLGGGPQVVDPTVKPRQRQMPTLESIAKDHPDTPYGRRAALELMFSNSIYRKKNLAHVDAFIKKHKGTPAAAMALFRKGKLMQSNWRRFAPYKGKPIAAFREQLSIHHTLTNDYADTEWADKAPEILSYFYPGRGGIKNGSSLAGPLQAAYLRDPEAISLYIIRNVVAGERQTDRPAPRTRAFLMGLADKMKDPAPALLAVASLDYAALERAIRQTADTGEILNRLKATLARITSPEHTPRARHALGLAYARAGRYEEALAAFKDAGTDGPYGAVSTIRRRLLMSLSPRLDTVALHGSTAHETVWLNWIVAREAEHNRDFATAAKAYRQAAGSWDDDFGTTYRLDPMVVRAARVNEPFAGASDVTLDDLAHNHSITRFHLVQQAERIERYKDTAFKDLALWTRAAQARLADKPDEATTLLKQLRTEFGKSSLARRAGYDLVAIATEQKQYKEAGELAEKLLRSDPVSDWSVLAGIAGARALAKLGLEKPGVAERIETVFDTYFNKARLKLPDDPVARDAAAIRQVLVKANLKVKRGDDELPMPLGFTPARLTVTLHDGTLRQLVIPQHYEGNVRLIPLGPEAVGELERLSGHRSMVHRGAQEEDRFVLRDYVLCTGFQIGFGVTWGQYVNRVHFTNPERTRATAAFSEGQSGYEVYLEKRDDTWVVTGKGARWIS